MQRIKCGSDRSANALWKCLECHIQAMCKTDIESFGQICGLKPAFTSARKLNDIEAALDAQVMLALDIKNPEIILGL